MPINATAITSQYLRLRLPRWHYRGCLEKHEAGRGASSGKLAALRRTCSSPGWMSSYHPKIVDAAEDLLGPNLLCWTTNFFIKEANSPGFVSWHQDAFYWGLSKDDVMTAWVALACQPRKGAGSYPAHRRRITSSTSIRSTRTISSRAGRRSPSRWTATIRSIAS